MVTGLADEDVHKEMIGWESLDESMRQSVFWSKRDGTTCYYGLSFLIQILKENDTKIKW